MTTAKHRQHRPERQRARDKDPSKGVVRLLECRGLKRPRLSDLGSVGSLVRFWVENCHSGAGAEGRSYEPLTKRGARVHAVRQAMAMFAEMLERLELAREAYAEAREEGQGHVSAGLAALRAVAGRQGKEMDQDEIKQRLAGIAGRDVEALEAGREAGAIRDRLKQVLGRDAPDLRQEQQQERDEERKRQLELGRQRERDRDLGWEL